MKPSTTIIANKIKLGWIFFAVSLVLILGGLGVRFFRPELHENVQWIIGLGILALGVSIAILSSYLPAMRSSKDAARQVNADLDERNLSIRNAAGYIAFLVSMVINFAALYVYSALTRGTGFDPLWYVLAALSVFPVLVFIIFMVVYQKKM